MILNKAKMYLGDILISGGGVYEYDQTSGLVSNFLANVTYDSSDYTTSEIENYAPSTSDVDNTHPSGVNIDGKTYYNHIPNKYSAILLDDNQSAVVKPTHFLRQIKSVTSNVRDLGGWNCDGGTVKYGKLFRGGEISENDIDLFVNQLGVRQELNLRGKDEAGNKTFSILGSEIGYICTEGILWYSLTNETDWKTTLRCVFDAIKSNKPVYFHCSAGADRTGTVACILEAILGMSQNDIDKEYELTTFKTGTSTDANARRRNEPDWQGLITQINALSVGTTFRDKIINWIASLGFTIDEINNFRKTMIDGTPDTITLSIGNHTITNNLTNAENSNAETSIAKYQPYNADISVPEGYAIEKITITMGGTDITKTVFDGKPTNLFRVITKNLTNCTIDNARKVVIDGQGYVGNVVINDGYTLEGGTVSLTMGGIDIMANYYSEGKIAIPNVTGDIEITVQAVKSASPITVIPIVWNDGYSCSYTVGTDFGLTENDSYITSDVIQVQAGIQYNFNIKSAGVTNTSMRIVGADSSGKVTEVISLGNIYTDNSYQFTVKDGTTQIRLRGYADTGFNNTSMDTISYE